jgi:hypothetical protein
MTNEQKITMKLVDALDYLSNIDTFDLHIESKIYLHTAQNIIVEALNISDNKNHKIKTFIEDNPGYIADYNEFFDIE